MTCFITNKKVKNCIINAEMSPITSCWLSEEKDGASELPDPGSTENGGESEYTLSQNIFLCEVLNKGKDASSELPLHDVMDSQQSDECESSSSPMICSQKNLNMENAVSDSRELLSYAIIVGVKHIAVLVKFDETEFDAIQVNFPTHINKQVEEDFLSVKTIIIKRKHENERK